MEPLAAPIQHEDSSHRKRMRRSINLPDNLKAEVKDLKEMLTKKTVPSVLEGQPSRNVVSLFDDNTVEQALKLFANHRIISAPVYARTDNMEKLSSSNPKDWHEHGVVDARIIGFIDLRDILTGFVAAMPSVDDVLAMRMLQKMKVLEAFGQTFSQKRLKELPVIGRDGGLLSEQQASKTTVRDLIIDVYLGGHHQHSTTSPPPSLMASDSQGGSMMDWEAPTPSSTYTPRDAPTPTMMHTQVEDADDDPEEQKNVAHRLGIYNGAGVVTQVVSQTDVLRYLALNMDLFEGLQDTPLSDLGVVSLSSVVTVRPETSAIEALILMYRENLTAVGVVDSLGTLIGNFSLSDLRCITPEHFGALALPVAEFIALEHGTEFVGYSIPSPATNPTVLEAVKNDMSPSKAKAGPVPRSSSPPLGAAIPPSFNGPMSPDTKQHMLSRGQNLSFIRRRDEYLKGKGWVPGTEVGQVLQTAKVSTPFATALENLVRNHIHRLWIVDDDIKPVGSMSTVDVLRVMASAMK